MTAGLPLGDKKKSGHPRMDIRKNKRRKNNQLTIAIPAEAPILVAPASTIAQASS